jgi:hypothetical protein
MCLSTAAIGRIGGGLSALSLQQRSQELCATLLGPTPDFRRVQAEEPLRRSGAASAPEKRREPPA